jgi:hypothetical protein
LALAVIYDSLDGLLLSRIIVQVLHLHFNDVSEIHCELFHEFLETALVLQSLLKYDSISVCQRYALRVLGHKENFPATGENPDDVGI